MNVLKRLLVLVITASLSLPPSLTSQVFAYYDPTEDGSGQQTMPEYNEPFQTPQETVKLPEEDEPELAPEVTEPILNAAGDSIKLQNGIELTEQDDGTFRDEDGNKWVKIEDEDGTESYRQVGFQRGEEIELTDGTKLTADEAYELTEDFKLPDGLKLVDDKNNRWKISEGHFQQIDFDKGHVITLTDGTELTAQSDFSVDETTFELPEGLKLLDDKNNNWTISEGHFQQIDFDKGHVITLKDGTKLTAQSDFSVDEKTFAIPEGIKFLDDKGNRWVNTKDHFQQIDFDKGDVITLSGGKKLTAQGDFSLDDKTFKIPDNVKFADQDGNVWISKDGNYSQLGFSAGTQLTLNNGIVLTAATPYTRNDDGSIPAGVLFTMRDGTLIVTTAAGGFKYFNTAVKASYDELQIMNDLKGMNDADAAALLAKCDPIFSGLILLEGFDDNQKIGAILEAMDPDSAAKIVDALFYLDVTARTHNWSEWDLRYSNEQKKDDPTLNNSVVPQGQTHEISVQMTQEQLDRIKQIAGVLANMAPEKAAAILGSSEMSLTSAGKALYAIQAGSLKTVSEAVIAALDKLDANRARNVKDVLAYYKTIKGQTAYAWQTPSAAQTFKTVMSAKARPLTADEKTIYSAIFAKTPNQIEEYVMNGKLEQAFWTEGANSQGSIQGLVGAIITDLINTNSASVVSRYAPYIGTTEVDAASIIASLAPEQQELAKSILNIREAKPEDTGLSDIGTIGADAAAEKITGYVKDAVTAKEAADALANLDASIAAAILASGNLSVATAAAILDTMDPAKAAAILTYSKITTVPGGRVMDPPAISRQKSADILLAMDAEKAAAVTGEFAGLALDPAIVGGEILGTMPTEKAAELISKIPAANGKTSVQVQASLFAVMSHVIVAKILASGNMPAAAGAAILAELKKTDEARVELFLTQLDTIDDVKADQIRDIINGTSAQARWSYVIDQDGTLFWSDSSRGLPEPGKVYTQALTPLTAEETAQYFSFLKGQDTAKITDMIRNNKISIVTAARLLDQLESDKAAEIINSLYPAQAISGGSGALPVTLGAPNGNEIISAMDPAKAAAVLASSKLQPGLAAKIVNSLNVDTAIKILSKMDPAKAAGILSTANDSIVGGNALKPLIPSAEAAEILAGMETGEAAAIMNCMHAGFAALIVNALNEDTAVKILGAMDPGKVAGILVAEDDNGAVAPQYHTHWDVVTVDKAADLLSKLDAAKAEAVLAALDGLDKVKADQIRAKIAPATDISGMSADEAADYLIKLNDPAKAAMVIVNDNLSLTKAIAIMASLRSADARIFYRIVLKAYKIDRNRTSQIAGNLRGLWAAWNIRSLLKPLVAAPVR